MLDYLLLLRTMSVCVREPEKMIISEKYLRDIENVGDLLIGEYTFSEIKGCIKHCRVSRVDCVLSYCLREPRIHRKLWLGREEPRCVHT